MQQLHNFTFYSLIIQWIVLKTTKYNLIRRDYVKVHCLWSFAPCFFKSQKTPKPVLLLPYLFYSTSKNSLPAAFENIHKETSTWALTFLFWKIGLENWWADVSNFQIGQMISISPMTFDVCWLYTRWIIVLIFKYLYIR